MFTRYLIRRVLATTSRSLSSYPPHLVVGMPALSPTMTSGTIGTWHKKVGDLIKAGETFADIETDKASMAFEAQDDAYIAKILVDAGKEVGVGLPILVTVDDAASVDAFKDFTLAAAPAAAAIPAVAPTAVPTPSKPVAEAVTPVAAPVSKAPAPVAATVIASTSQPAAPVTSATVTDSSNLSAVGQVSLLWGSGVKKSVLVNKLSKEQKAYIAKYGASAHKPI